MPEEPTRQTLNAIAKLPADLSFEQAQAELEAIISQIESGEVGLEAAVGRYERGVALVKHCRGILEKSEQRFTDLTNEMQAATKSAKPA